MIKGKDFIGVGCGGFIINEKNQILLLKRGLSSGNRAGFWTVPGGSVKKGEKVEEALKRELKEECDIDVAILKLLTVSNDIILEEDLHWVSPQFLCKIIGGEPKNLETHKHDDLKWFDLNNLPDKIINTTIDGLNELNIPSNSL